MRGPNENKKIYLIMGGGGVPPLKNKKKRSREKNAEQLSFDAGARMTSRSSVGFVGLTVGSSRAVHHSPSSCVIVSYSKASLQKHKSTAE